MSHKKIVLVILIFVALSMVIAASVLAQDELTPKEKLGEFLYFDEKLSQPTGQSCASCHHPDFGFVDPDSDLPVSEGVLPNLFGGRNSPSSAYAMYSPTFYFDEEEGLWIGGQFWDGRATGFVLGDPLADQALGPFTNPVEMANKTRYTVVRDVANSKYADLFEEVWDYSLKAYSRFSDAEIDKAYEDIALSIAAFERTELFAPFTSKYDYYLQACLELGGDPNMCAEGVDTNAAAAAAEVGFTDQEWDGFLLFMDGEDGGAKCVLCHVADWTEDPGNVVVPQWASEYANGKVPPLFTDFTYDNLGVPKNLAYPFDPDAPVDLGLGVTVNDPDENGKFKVMTLRNVGITEPYAHNGFFLTLKEITHFYNTRDVDPMWPESEYPDTVNTDELGDLGLSDADENALVAFMETLTDGYTP